MSRLIDKLTRSKKTEPQPMGFALSRAVHQKPRLQLIARVAAKDLERLGAVLTLSDALLVDTAVDVDVDAVHRVCQIEGASPAGGWVRHVEGDLLPRLADTGCDFVVFPASAPLTVLRKEKMGRLLEVDLALPDNLLRTINDLPVEAIVVREDTRENAGVLLTFDRLMAIQRLAYLITKPILLVIPAGLEDEELQALWDAGVSGLIVAVPDAKAAENLTPLVGRLEKLIPPSAHKKPRLSTPVIPHLQAEPVAPQRVEEEEEEEE